MPDGVKGLVGERFLRPSDATDTPIVRSNEGGFQQLYEDLSRPFTGTHTENIPAQGRINPGGRIAGSFVNDYYNRVHFFPTSLDYGAIAQNTERKLKVWNAHFVTNDLQTITIDPAIGVSYTTGDSLPWTFGGLQELEVGFTASVSGVSGFDEFILFGFELRDPYTYRVVGERSVLRKDGPNWRDAMVETFQYKTEIVNKSRSGREQRRALRPEPRRDLSYLWTTQSPAARREFQALLTRWKRRTVLLQLYPYRVKTTTDTLAATLVLDVEFVPWWALPNQNILIADPFMPQDVNAIIDSVDDVAKTITVLAPTPAAIPEGALVFPLLTSRLKESQRVTQYSAEVEEAVLTYENSPGFDPRYYPPDATEFLGGYELWLEPPNMAESPEQQWQMPVEQVDAGWGRKTWFEYQDFTTYTKRMRYTGLRDAKVREIIDLFYRHKGMLGEFWMPTFTNDIIPDYLLEQDATTIRIKGTDFERDWENQSTHKAIIIYLNDGSYLTREVINIDTLTDGFGTDTVIDVATAWPRDIQLTEIDRVQWLLRVRFATDILRIEWETDEVANVQFSIRTLEAL